MLNLVELLNTLSLSIFIIPVVYSSPSSENIDGAFEESVFIARYAYGALYVMAAPFVAAQKKPNLSPSLE